MKFKEIAKASAPMMTPLIMLIVCVFCLFSASVAWFSMNKITNSNGMQISVGASPNMVIAKTQAEITAINPAGATDSIFSITYTSNNPTRKMIPATEDWAIGTETGLKYVSNTWDVSYTSGTVKDGGTLEYAAVPGDTSSLYYLDYDVYIASVSLPMERVSLSASLSCASQIDSHKAATIVFYKDSVASANRLGAISVSNQPGSVSIPLTNNTIPLNTAGSIHIVMRCFFDGALTHTEGDSTYAYIRSTTVDTTDVSLAVYFTATDIPSTP